MRTIKIRRNILVEKNGTAHATWQVWSLVLRGWTVAQAPRDNWSTEDVRKHYAAYGLNVEFEKVHFETED